MAIEEATFAELVPIVREFRRDVSLLSLGYPDLLVSQEALSFAGISPDTVRLADDQEAVARWHKWQGKIYETTSVFGRLGISPTYLDIRASRGVEAILDLNQRVEVTSRYDIVLDPGTLEHCFNIGLAFSNVLRLTKVGGYVMHVNPCTMVNHGFYNLNPTAYKDFYEQNGARIIKLYGLAGPPRERQRAVLDPVARTILPSETSLLVIVQKTEECEPAWPTQTKYLLNASLKS